MDKWLFEPTRDEMAGMLRPLFAPQLAAAEVDVLLDAFPAQVGAFRESRFGSVVGLWCAERWVQHRYVLEDACPAQVGSVSRFCLFVSGQWHYCTFAACGRVECPAEWPPRPFSSQPLA